MIDLQRRGICIFCPEHIKIEHREPIELETTHWLVTKNDYPYEHTTLHLLVIPKHHVSTIGELSTAAQSSFLETIAAVEQKWSLKSYALGLRSGDFRYNGGTIEHLHAHIIVGE